jgi:Recombination endonuclease VII
MPKPRRAQLGVSLEQYEEMLARQNGVCPICLLPPKVRRLDLDHDHRTGKVRGLLTHKCNRGLAYFADDPARLRRAADYLEGKL